MMEIRREKVEDIHVGPSKDIVHLIDQMYSAGGFMGKNLAEAARVLSEMLNERECTKFLSFPAAIIATGLRGVIIDMIKNGMVDVIITTTGTIDHDIARTFSHYYHGSFDLDDIALHKSGYHRVGSIIVPMKNYGPLIEQKVQKLLTSLYSNGTRVLSSEELCKEIGRLTGSDASLLYWAMRKGIPVFIPGIMDGAVGSQIWLFCEKHKDFKIDVIKDQKRLSDIVFSSKKTGAIIIGGGISKHHTLWWNQFKGGLDYACYITTAVEYDGSLSGARVREAISWGKVKERARHTTLYADVTTVLPFLVSYALTKKSNNDL